MNIENTVSHDFASKIGFQKLKKDILVFYWVLIKKNLGFVALPVLCATLKLTSYRYVARIQNMTEWEKFDVQRNPALIFIKLKFILLILIHFQAKAASCCETAFQKDIILGLY
ncbi:MAG: hypothetical protein WDA08_10395 [Weeksellaceae bacterium]